uniref:Uncharacterized protein n=1 Tax=Rhodosorus marinus TaxID=101924 RepID=A0A7S0G7F1_9RHOD
MVSSRMVKTSELPSASKRGHDRTRAWNDRSLDERVRVSTARSLKSGVVMGRLISDIKSKRKGNRAPGKRRMKQLKSAVRKAQKVEAQLEEAKRTLRVLCKMREMLDIRKNFGEREVLLGACRCHEYNVQR